MLGYVLCWLLQVSGLVVELRVAVGDAVNAGDELVVVSAMKTETMVTCDVSGVVTAVQPIQTGERIGSGDMIAVIDTAAEGGVRKELPDSESWDFIMRNIARRRQLAIDRLNDLDDPGVARQKSRGKLTCRERIALLLDDGSFREIGSVAGFATLLDGELLDFTAASHVRTQSTSAAVNWLISALSS